MLSPDTDYNFPPAPSKAELTRALWNSVMGSIGLRIRTLEAKRTELQDLIDDLSFNGQARLDQAIVPLIEQTQAQIDDLKAQVAATIAANGAIIANFQVDIAAALLALNNQVDAVEARVNLILQGGIPAADVAESATRVFVTPTQRDAIGPLVSDVAARKRAADPLEASPIPPSLDIVFAEGFKPPKLSVMRASTGTRVDKFGATVATAVNELRHNYAPDGTYRGVLAESPDVITIPTAGWLNPVEGTLFFEGWIGEGASEDNALSLDDGSTANVIRLYRQTGSGRFGLNGTAAGTSSIATFHALNTAPNSLVRVAFSFKGTTLLCAVNGAAEAFSMSAPVPGAAVSTLRLGRRTNGTAWDGTILSVAFIPRALAAADLQNITRIAA